MTHGVSQLNDVGSRNETDECQNLNFVQVSRTYLKEWRALTRKNPLASEILMYLIEHMGRTTNAVVCSYVTLMEVTGVSRSSVARAMRVLKEDAWIDAIKIGNATAYGINARAFWQASRNQKKYAIFQATVIASATEQDPGVVEQATPLRYIPFVGAKGARLIPDDEQLPPPDQQDMELN